MSLNEDDSGYHKGTGQPKDILANLWMPSLNTVRPAPWTGPVLVTAYTDEVSCLLVGSSGILGIWHLVKSIIYRCSSAHEKGEN